jgi:hypothetical protein
VGAAKVVKVAAHAAGVGAREVRGIRHQHEAHAGWPIDFGAVAVGGEVAEKTVIQGRALCAGWRWIGSSREHK